MNRNEGKIPGWFRRGLIIANTAMAWAVIWFLALTGREGMTASTLIEGCFIVIGGGIVTYAGSAYLDDRLKRPQEAPGGPK